MWETDEERAEFDAQVEERGEAEEADDRVLHHSNVAYALDIEQDLVIEIPLHDGSVARATLSPDLAYQLLNQIRRIVGVAYGQD
jgi:hypothetical protein